MIYSRYTNGFPIIDDVKWLQTQKADVSAVNDALSHKLSVDEVYNIVDKKIGNDVLKQLDEHT